MSGCAYCEDGEGAELIAYAKAVKPVLEQLLSNHKARIERGVDEATSALSLVNGIQITLMFTGKGGTDGQG